MTFVCFVCIASQDSVKQLKVSDNANRFTYTYTVTFENGHGQQGCDEAVTGFPKKGAEEKPGYKYNISHQNNKDQVCDCVRKPKNIHHISIINSPSD